MRDHESKPLPAASEGAPKGVGFGISELEEVNVVTSGRKRPTAKTLRFSQLSASRQVLVRLCQNINFGQIQDLHVRNSELVWDPAPTVLSEIKLDIEEAPRPESELPDFKLSSQIQRLMHRLDQLTDGRIERIEVREGIPRRLVLTSRLALSAVHRTPPCGDPV
jgi:hypothetical protein